MAATIGTSSRITLTPQLPKPLAEAIAQETEREDCSMATLMRRIVRWHKGQAPKGFRAAPPVKYPAGTDFERVTKTFQIGESEAAYLDKLANRTGLSRVTVMLMLAFQWFEIDALAPLPPEQQ